MFVITQSKTESESQGDDRRERRKERSDGIAIATKSIASSVPTRSGRRGFPALVARGNAGGGNT